MQAIEQEVQSCIENLQPEGDNTDVTERQRRALGDLATLFDEDSLKVRARSTGAATARERGGRGQA
jgi:hypothetical protein